MAILPSLSHTLQVCIYLRCPLLHRTCTCRTLGEGSEEISCHPLSLELLVCSYLSPLFPPSMHVSSSIKVCSSGTSSTGVRRRV